jgi:dTDP-4-amino-4,6-dideoxy-D-galactose acyltransferase
MPTNLNNILELKWDSDFFAYKVGKVELNKEQILDDIKIKASNEGYRLVYLFSENQLEQKNTLFCDVKLTYQKNKIQKQEPTTEVSEFANDDDILPLYELAFTAGEFSRFNRDPKFTQDSFKKMYRKWIDNSVSKQIADKIFVIKADKIQAFATLKVKDKIAKIGLIAVGNEFQNQGLGKNLLAKINNFAAENSIELIQVETQESNINACRFYEKNTYELCDKKYIYHLWL